MRGNEGTIDGWVTKKKEEERLKKRKVELDATKREHTRIRGCPQNCQAFNRYTQSWGMTFVTILHQKSVSVGVYFGNCQLLQQLFLRLFLFKSWASPKIKILAEPLSDRWVGRSPPLPLPSPVLLTPHRRNRLTPKSLTLPVGNRSQRRVLFEVAALDE